MAGLSETTAGDADRADHGGNGCESLSHGLGVINACGSIAFHECHRFGLGAFQGERADLFRWGTADLGSPLRGLGRIVLMSLGSNLSLGVQTHDVVMGVMLGICAFGEVVLVKTDRVLLDEV